MKVKIKLPKRVFDTKYTTWADTWKEWIKSLDGISVTLTEPKSCMDIRGWHILERHILDSFLSLCFIPLEFIQLLPVEVRYIGLCDECGGINRHEVGCHIGMRNG